MLNLLGIILNAWLVATPVPAAAATAKDAKDASDVVTKVQSFYANIKQVTAAFRQEVTNQTFGSTKSSDGKVWLSKPGKMRWDYYEKKPDKTVTTKKSFISNGTSLYVIEHDNKQVVKKNLQQDLMPVAVTFLYGSGDLNKEFNAEVDKGTSYGDSKTDTVLKLTPKQPSAQYKNLYLVVANDNFRVKESIIIDSSGNVNHFHFYAPDFEAPIAQTWFEFDPKSVKNYRVIDADADDKGSAGAAAAPAAPAPPVPAPPVPAPPVPAPSAPAPKKP